MFTPVDQFPVALAFTFTAEGGYDNDTRDTGNWFRGVLTGTNLGLTADDLFRMNPKHVPTPADMRAITRASATPIYRTLYWRAVDGDALRPGVSLTVFDHGVLAGVGTSARLLQETLGLTGDDVDGDIGVHTSTMAESYGGDLIRDLAIAQAQHYRDLENPTYIQGWLNRVEARRQAAYRAASKPIPWMPTGLTTP